MASTKEAILKRYNERYQTYVATADVVIPNGDTAEAAAQQVKRSFFL